MKYFFSFLALCLFSLNSVAQSPFDEIAPETKVAPMIGDAKVFSISFEDSLGNKRFFTFDADSRKISLYEILPCGHQSVISDKNLKVGESKFLSVDPLMSSFPWNSTYAFAENRVIDGIDLEGREWDYSVIPQNDGTTKLKITVNIDLTMDANAHTLLGNDVEKYKSAIRDQFTKTLSKSSGGTFLGEVTFGTSLDSKRATPTYTITANKYNLIDPDNQLVVVGQTMGSYGSLNLFNKYDQLTSPEDFAETTAHELFHTIRIEHPFEVTQASDTELLKQGKKFFNTSNTDPNINLNIMVYNSTIINGQRMKDARIGQKADLLTKGQLNLMQSEIDLQKSGKGLSISDEYWLTAPGYEVKPKN
jgi:hypothetical protein